MEKAQHRSLLCSSLMNHHGRLRESVRTRTKLEQYATRIAIPADDPRSKTVSHINAAARFRHTTVGKAAVSGCGSDRTGVRRWRDGDSWRIKRQWSAHPAAFCILDRRLRVKACS